MTNSKEKHGEYISYNDYGKVTKIEWYTHGHFDCELDVTDGEHYLWSDIFNSAIKILNVRAKKLVIPEVLLPLYSYFFEALAWFGSKPPLFDRQRMIDICQTSWIASPKEFFESHMFKPQYDLAKGLQETIDLGNKNNWL